MDLLARGATLGGLAICMAGGVVFLFGMVLVRAAYVRVEGY